MKEHFQMKYRCTSYPSGQVNHFKVGVWNEEEAKFFIDLLNKDGRPGNKREVLGLPWWTPKFPILSYKMLSLKKVEAT